MAQPAYQPNQPQPKRITRPKHWQHQAIVLHNEPEEANETPTVNKLESGTHHTFLLRILGVIIVLQTLLWLLWPIPATIRPTAMPAATHLPAPPPPNAPSVMPVFPFVPLSPRLAP